jgi:hypothetical protein
VSARIVETAARLARERLAMAALALVPELVITDAPGRRAVPRLPPNNAVGRAGPVG